MIASPGGARPDRLVEFSERYIRSRRRIIVEAEAVRKRRSSDCLRGKAVVVPNGSGILVRLAKVGGQHVGIGICRDLAKPVHGVAEGESGWGRRHLLIGMADHGGAQHFVESADVRQPGGAVPVRQDRLPFGLPSGSA